MEEEVKRVYDPLNQLPVTYYDSKTGKGIDERKTTSTYRHRAFNNYIKSVLIQKYVDALNEEYRREQEQEKEQEDDENWGMEDTDNPKRGGRRDKDARKPKRME